MDFLLLIVGAALLYWGGEWLVTGASALARHLGLSSLVIGLTVVAFGTSAPELAATLTATLTGSPAIAFGNVVGSNIANLGLILGITGLIHPLVTTARFLWREVPFMLGASVLMTALALDGMVGRLEGLLLFALLVPYLVYLLRDGGESPTVAAGFDTEYGEGEGQRLLRHTLKVVAGIALLVLGAKALISGAVGIARFFGVPERIIGLTLVAFGTSLPELASAIVAALKREGDIILGNLIGSNVFNILAILGVTAMVRPVEVERVGALGDLIAMLALSFLVWPFLRSGLRLRRLEGGILLLAYLLYLGWLMV